MKRRKFLWILILICFFTGLRFVYLPADPPWDISTSAAIFTDECHNVHCVRNKLLFGEWQMDKYNSFIYSPLWTILQYPVLRLLGIGLAQIKVLGIILSFLGMILIYKSFREYFGYGYGILAVTLTGLNYILIMYNRLGLYENLIIFFMVLTLFLWQRAIRTKRYVYFFLTGCAAFLVLVSKGMTAHFLVAFLITLVFSHAFRRGGWRTCLKCLGFSILGIIAVAGVWYLFFYHPNIEEIQVLKSGWLRRFMSPHPVKKILIGTNPVFHRLRFMPATLIVCWFYCIGLLNRRPMKLEPVEMLIFLWLVGAATFPNMLTYNPLRYYLPAIPPLIFLSVIFIMRLAGESDGAQRMIPSCRFYTLNFLFLSGTFFYFVIPYTRHYVHRIAEIAHIQELNILQTLTLSLFLGAGLTFVIAFIVRLRKTLSLISSFNPPIPPFTKGGDREIGGGYRWGCVLRRLVAVFITVAILVINANFYLQWVLEPGYIIRDTSRKLGSMLEPDSLIVGQGVMPLLIETKVRYVQYPNWYEDGKKIFYDYPVTHLYLPDYAGHLRWFKKHYPVVLKYSKKMATYKIWEKKFYLFELNVPPEKRETAFRYR